MTATLERRISRLELDNIIGPGLAEWLAAIERGDAGWLDRTSKHPQGMRGLSDEDMETLIGIFRSKIDVLTEAAA